MMACAAALAPSVVTDNGGKDVHGPVSGFLAPGFPWSVQGANHSLNSGVPAQRI